MNSAHHHTYFQPQTFHQRLSRIREKMFLNDDPSNKLYLEGFVDAMKKVNFGPNEEGVRRDCDEYAALMVNAEDFEEVATLGRLVMDQKTTVRTLK